MSLTQQHFSAESDPRPVVCLLCGLSGSGKTTAARALEGAGYERLSVDEVIHVRHGREGVDFPESDYARLHEEIIVELDRRLIELLAQRRNVVLDYGQDLWTKAGRERYKRIVEDHGGRWELRYLQADREVLRERLNARSVRSDANAPPIGEDLMERFIAQFEEPTGEMEVVYTQRHPGRDDPRT